MKLTLRRIEVKDSIGYLHSFVIPNNLTTDGVVEGIIISWKKQFGKKGKRFSFGEVMEFSDFVLDFIIKEEEEQK